MATAASLASPVNRHLIYDERRFLKIDSSQPLPTCKLTRSVSAPASLDIVSLNALFPEITTARANQTEPFCSSSAGSPNEEIERIFQKRVAIVSFKSPDPTPELLKSVYVSACSYHVAPQGKWHITELSQYTGEVPLDSNPSNESLKELLSTPPRTRSSLTPYDSDQGIVLDLSRKHLLLNSKTESSTAT